MMAHALSLALGILIMGLTVFVALVCWGMHEAIIERRERRRMVRINFETRPKAAIVKIGGVVTDALGRKHPHSFEIDCQGFIPATGLSPDGERLFGNWTVSELVEMAQRREEWEDRE